MRYEGNINQGTDYILLDDFITSGAELRDLRDYVESKGGHVVLISTLGHGSYSKLSDIRIDIKYKEKLLNLRQTAAEFNILTRENEIRKRWAEKFRNPEQYANQNLHQRFTKNKA